MRFFSVYAEEHNAILILIIDGTGAKKASKSNQHLFLLHLDWPDFSMECIIPRTLSTHAYPGPFEIFQHCRVPTMKEVIFMHCVHMLNIVNSIDSSTFGLVTGTNAVFDLILSLML